MYFLKVLIMNILKVISLRYATIILRRAAKYENLRS